MKEIKGRKGEERRGKKDRQGETIKQTIKNESKIKKAEKKEKKVIKAKNEGKKRKMRKE